MATIPPESRVNEARSNPPRAIIVAKTLGIRKARDQFDEIAIGLRIARDETAEQRECTRNE